MPESHETSVGAMIHARRRLLKLSLDEVASRVGCAKSYLSQIENGHRGPPSESVLRSLEVALSLPEGKLVGTAQWEQTPSLIRRDIARLQASRRATDELGRLLSEGDLDRAYRTGELHRLVQRLAPASESPVPIPMPTEIPLINSVSAGYPQEFTDLGYPARIADEYVRYPDLSDPDAFAARVVGDSMSPEYVEGDIVVFSPARDVRDGDDCFVRFEDDDGTTFKRVFFEPEPGAEESGSAGAGSGEPSPEESGRDEQDPVGGRIRIQPINSRYPPRTLPREAVAGLYAAVSVVRAIRPGG